MNIARLQTTPLVDQTPATERLPMEEVIDMMRLALAMLVVRFPDAERGPLRAIVDAASITAIEPVVPGVWVSRGAHVNAVGA